MTITTGGITSAKALPGGEWYDFNGHGPYELSADGRNYFKKGGAK